MTPPIVKPSDAAPHVAASSAARRMASFFFILSVASPWLVAGCRSPASEPAPPPASYELASAAPGARGARAAGTDAAPPRPSEGVLGELGEDEDEDEAETEAEPESDGGLSPDASGGVAL
jgi:hypothetical protein